MNKDDPFGLENDAARTRIRPLPKTRTRAAPASGGMAQAPQTAGFTPGARLKDCRASDNPLLNSYAPLLGMAPELERATAPENPDVLRSRLHDNLTYARDTAVTMGVPLTRADQGAWFVAALLDDIALNTPWGGASGWPRHPLVVQMYGDIDAGERFFQLAEDLMRYPERDPELLELVFMCLSLGFRGKHRVTGAAGQAALTQLRSQMARILRDRDAEDAPLAPNWQGVLAADEPRRFVVPIWSIGVIALALIMGIYFALGLRLSGRGEQLYTLAGLLPPQERAEIFRPVIESTAPPELAEPLVFELVPLFKEAAPNRTASALTGSDDVALAKLAIQAASPELFRSGQSTVNEGYTELVDSVARVILENQELIGAVKVVGHTDSRGKTTSNQRLSEARAKTIADMLVSSGVPAGLVTSEGKGSAEPAATNDTRDGRAKNRRVEIILQKKV